MSPKRTGPSLPQCRQPVAVIDTKSLTTRSMSFRGRAVTDRPRTRSWASIAKPPVNAHRRPCAKTASMKSVGLNVTQANGRAAWQEVFHYHVHLIPRYGDDGFRPPWRSTSPSQEQLSDVQQQLLQK
jgi:hypothetical protein